MLTSSKVVNILTIYIYLFIIQISISALVVERGVAVILSIIYIDDMPNSSTLATVTHANCTKAFVPKKWDTLKCCLLCVHKTANRQMLQKFAKLDSFASKAAKDHPP